MKRFIVIAAALALSACQPPKSSSQKEADAANPLTPQTKAPPVTSQYSTSILDKTDTLPFELKESCAEALCGAPLVPDAAKEATAATTAIPLVNELTALIKKSYEEHAASNLALARKISVSHDLIVNTPLDGKYKALGNLFWAIRYLSRITKYWKDGAFDHEAVRKELAADLMLSDVDMVEKMLAGFLKSEELKDASYIDRMGLKAFFEMKTKSKDPAVVRTAMTEYATSILNRTRKMKADFPNVPITIDPGLEAVARGEDVDATGVDEFVSAIRGANLDQVYTTNLAINTQHDLDLEAEFTKFTDSTLASVRSANTASRVASRISARTKACAATANHIALIKLDVAQATANLQTLVSTIRPEALNAALSFVSDDETSAKLTEALSAIQFRTADSPDRAYSKIKQALMDRIKSAKENVDEAAKADPQVLMFEMISKNSTASQEEDRPEALCENNDPSYLSDYSLSAMGLISVSWPSLTKLETGYPVIAHEFGHIVSSVLAAMPKDKADTYNRTYTCVADRKKTSYDQSSTQEEDFADLFSSRVMDLMEPRGLKVSKMGCALMAASPSEGRWNSMIGLSMYWPSAYEASHSTDLYRLLQNEINRGHKLPSTCASIANTAFPFMTNRCVLSTR